MQLFIVAMCCVKCVQIRSFFWSVFSRIRTEYREYLSVSSPNAGKYGLEKTPDLDTFHAVMWNVFDRCFYFRSTAISDESLQR